jgi:hypothetical protein
MKWDAKNIAAVTGLVAVLLGGAELRMKVAQLEAKVERVDSRLLRMELEAMGRTVAQNDEEP